MGDNECYTKPCEPHKAFVNAAKWVVAILVFSGGSGIGISLAEAREAKQIAESANDKAQNISILENEISHVRDDLREVKTALSAVNDMKVTMAEMAGVQKLTLEKVDQLRNPE